MTHPKPTTDQTHGKDMPYIHDQDFATWGCECGLRNFYDRRYCEQCGLRRPPSPNSGYSVFTLEEE